MSSPIHLDENVDTALIYAPPWVRDRIPFSTGSTLRSRRATAPEMSAKILKPKYSGDRAMLKLQRQLALNPGLVPEPATEGVAVILPLLARLCSVSALAALVAWGLVSFSSVKKNVLDVPAATSTSAIATNHLNVIDVQSLRLRPTMSRTAQTLAPVGQLQPVATTTSADTALTPPAGSPQASVNRRQLRLDSEEIDVLITRGKDLLADGDVAAARLLLRRAAEAGSAEGAFTLGTTFDPISLARLGAIGAAPDLAQARQWYRRAAELGSSAASQQLAGLGEAR